MPGLIPLARRGSRAGSKLRSVTSAPDIPGYQVTGILASGGFATVYQCWQATVGREVAVKIDNRVLASERDRRRFIREVTAAGRLSGHPYVIEVYDAGTLRDGRPFLAMELCPAGSLDSLVREHGQMTGAQVRDIGIRIADALAAAHGAGVLHRDIKPGNILVNRYGMVGLADFGLASILAPEGELTVTRETLTPAYASPESFRMAEPTVAGDIYSLAATLYALLAGRPPRFPADSQPRSLAEILALHAQPIEDVPGAQPELMTMLHWGLAADPADRPPTAAALRDALAAVPGSRRPGTAARRPQPGHSGDSQPAAWECSGPVTPVPQPVAAAADRRRCRCRGSRGLRSRAPAARRRAGARRPSGQRATGQGHRADRTRGVRRRHHLRRLPGGGGRRSGRALPGGPGVLGGNCHRVRRRHHAERAVPQSAQLADVRHRHPAR